MNDSFVNIKVDREERPDIDAVYMSATQAMTGQGGWPMTVFMTPAASRSCRRTYFPRARFTQLVTAVADVAAEQGPDPERVGADQRSLAEQPPPCPAWRAGAPSCAGRADVAGGGRAPGRVRPGNGGFGGAPKFPPSMVLEFLLRHDARAGSARPVDGRADLRGDGARRHVRPARRRLRQVQRGRELDRAALREDALRQRAARRVYTHLWRRTGSARSPAGWPKRPATSCSGSCARRRAASPPRSTRTATAARARSTSGPRPSCARSSGRKTRVRGRGVRRHKDGTFEHGASVLQRRTEPDEQERFDRIRGILLTAREGDPPGPRRQGGRRLERHGDRRAGRGRGAVQPPRPGRRRDARRPSSRLGPLLQPEDRPPCRHGADPAHLQGRRGRAERGLLEDYACVAGPCSSCPGDRRGPLGDGGRRLLDTVLAAFADGNGGFYDTADDGERLIFRPADPTDNATPSGTFAAADALLSYGALTGVARYRDAAAAALKVLPPIAAKYPRAAGWAWRWRRRCCPGRPRSRSSARRRPAHRRPAPGGPARGPARRGVRPRPGSRRRSGPIPLLDGPAAGLRRPGGLRVPRLHLPGPGHHPGGVRETLRAIAGTLRGQTMDGIR